jgi:phosphatidylglycerophosphate synthase
LETGFDAVFDRQLLLLTKPLVIALARRFHHHGISANQVSIFGFGIGIISAGLISSGFTTAALLPLAINRILDGIDGAIARFGVPSDRGAFLDVTLDFLFYAAVPLGFAMLDPDRNSLAAAFLLAAFIGTGTSFLAFAIIAEKRDEKSSKYPSKSFYYLGGIAEGSETILCFVLMCFWPQYFALIANVYSALCAVTTATRLVAGWMQFGSKPSTNKG